MNAPKCLILTTGHHAEDARLHRHVDALEHNGFESRTVAVPIRRWMRFLAPPLIVWRRLRSEHPAVAIFPDPELFVVGPLLARILRVRSVIDIHEDYSAVAMTRDWIPGPVRTPIGWAVDLSSKLGRRLADATIVADRHLAMPGDLVVPNLPDPRLLPSTPPTPLRSAIVYVGDITEARGAFEMVDLICRTPGVTLELIGPISDTLRAQILLRASDGKSADRIRFFGRLPYEAAWKRANGAVAGLSLLHPTPAYRAAVPSKVWEYLAAGLPVIASDLPAQRRVIEESGGGAVVTGIDEATAVLKDWLLHPEEASQVGALGRAHYLSTVDRVGGGTALITAVGGFPMA